MAYFKGMFFLSVLANEDLCYIKLKRKSKQRKKKHTGTSAILKRTENPSKAILHQDILQKKEKKSNQSHSPQNTPKPSKKKK